MRRGGAVDSGEETVMMHSGSQLDRLALELFRLLRLLAGEKDIVTC